MDSELLLIGVTTINGYVSQNTDTACWYTKNPFLEIHPYTGGGQHIPAGLPYPPLKILEQGLFIYNEMTLKYYIT